MRWLAYLAIVLGLLAVGLWVYLGRPVDTGPPVGEPPAQPPPAAGPSAPEPAKGTITVEGEGLSPEAKQVLAEGVHKLLGEAVNKAVSKAVEDLFRKLRVAD